MLLDRLLEGDHFVEICMGELYILENVIHHFLGR